MFKAAFIHWLLHLSRIFLWSVVLGLLCILYLKRGAVSHIATVYNFDECNVMNNDRDFRMSGV